MRIIDADIIMADLNSRADYADMLIMDIKDYIAEQPTIDLIHCKDCKWKLLTQCTRFEYLPVTDEDYCSKAERRTDENN